jgi:phosphatidate cytidylyltransferase
VTAGTAAYPKLTGAVSRMLLKRTLTTLALAVIGIPAIILGGVYYYALMTLFLALATWEYCRIYSKMDGKAPMVFLVGCVVLLVTARIYFPEHAATVLSLSILVAMTWHLVDFEKGRDRAATDFAITVCGILYLGWIGAYLIELRNLPDGMWWLLIVLPTIWLADMAAYFIGVRFGKHKLCPRLSPKKTWEGYWAGVVFGTLSTLGLGYLWHSLGGPAVPWWQAIALGAVLSTLTTLGDLGESMLKRQAGVKDASNIFPGHGGVLDRIDSWLWGAALGFLFITWFMI